MPVNAPAPRTERAHSTHHTQARLDAGSFGAHHLQFQRGSYRDGGAVLLAAGGGSCGPLRRESRRPTRGSVENVLFECA